MKFGLLSLLRASKNFKVSVEAFTKELEAVSTVSGKEVTPDESVDIGALLNILMLSSISSGISGLVFPEKVKGEFPKEGYDTSFSEFGDIKKTIMENEGFLGEARKLPGESGYSIGYGFYRTLPDGRKITEGMKISREEAERLLEQGISDRRKYVLRQLDKYGNGLSLNEAQINVLLDLAWQSGRGVERVLKAANGDVNKIIEELKFAASEHLESKDPGIKRGVKSRDMRRSLAFATATPGVLEWEGRKLHDVTKESEISLKDTAVEASFGSNRVSDKLPARETKRKFGNSVYEGVSSSTPLELTDLARDINHPDYTPEEWVSRGAFLSSPVSTTRITSHFGYRNAPKAGASYYHKGIDYGHRPGESTLEGDPIYAIADGRVVKKYFGKSGGNQLVLYHGNGIVSGYSHLSKYANVEVGDSVTRGQIIGYVGSTGVSTGAHLHFSIRVGASETGDGGEFVDPERFLSDYKKYYEETKSTKQSSIYYNKTQTSVVSRKRYYSNGIFNVLRF